MDNRLNRRRAFSWAVDATLQFGLAAILILPLFSVVYFENWGSIESTFMAHARFLVEHWPHPDWQPLWYGGTRFDYIYPPALPYGTAILAMVLGIPIVQAYHLYTAILYAIGISAVGHFVRYLSGSRASGWIAAAATALVSPSVLLIPEIQEDAFHRFLAPQRLNVLVGWGEGPHVSALALLPLALAASYWALTRCSPLGVALASAACALVVSNNFYGAVSLAISYLLLVWSLWVTRPDMRMLAWAAAIPAFSAGLAAFWLVPSYIFVTLRNLRTVEAAGRASDLAWAAVVLGVVALTSYRFAFRRPGGFYPIFISGLALSFSTIVLGHYWFGLRVFGTPVRFSPEFDLALTLAVLEFGRRVSARVLPSFKWGAHTGVAVSMLILVALSSTYLRHCWDLYKRDPHPEQRIEYQLSRWIAENLPRSRVFLEGSLRFWANVWHDIPQLSGGSDQGILNPHIAAPVWHLRHGKDPGPSIKWLQAFGIDSVVVNGANSAEVYHSFEHPRKFDGVLPVLLDNGEGDVIYRVPRRYPGLARVVNRSELSAAWEPPPAANLESLAAYVEAIEAGPPIAAVQQWRGPEELRVSAEFEEDQALLLQVTYDPTWRAETGGRSLPIQPDPLGQMVILVPPGRHEIEIRFGLPRENIAGRAITALTVLLLCLWVWSAYRRHRTAGSKRLA